MTVDDALAMVDEVWDAMVETDVLLDDDTTEGAKEIVALQIVRARETNGVLG